MTGHETMVWARLPLEKAYNVRELGGLPVEGGGQTLWRAFLRADDISALTEEDVAFLLGYGVGTVIDLRSDKERRENPDRLDERYGVDNIPVSFMEDTDLSPKSMEKYKVLSMGALYVDLLGVRGKVRALFVAIASAKPGCILFHCAVGKDRTGVLAMLLLMLAGVDKRDCVNNYCQSYQNLLRDETYLPRDGSEASRPLMESRAEYIEQAYDHVESLGGIEAYLDGCGIPAETIAAVRVRLVGESRISRK